MVCIQRCCNFLYELVMLRFELYWLDVMLLPSYVALCLTHWLDVMLFPSYVALCLTHWLDVMVLPSYVVLCLTHWLDVMLLPSYVALCLTHWLDAMLLPSYVALCLTHWLDVKLLPSYVALCLTDVPCRVGTAYVFGAPESTPGFREVRVVWALAFCVMFCRSVFVLCHFPFDYFLCVLSVILRYATSDYPFYVFKLFLAL